MPKPEASITLNETGTIRTGDTVTFTVEDAPPHSQVNLVAYPWTLGWYERKDVGEPFTLPDAPCSVVAYLIVHNKVETWTSFEVVA